MLYNGRNNANTLITVKTKEQKNGG